MNASKKTVKSIICIMLTVLMIITSLSALTVFAADSKVELASTGAHTYYCKDTSWSQVYCYCWDDSGNNSQWPGAAMTSKGDGVWAYTPAKDYSNVIFNNGSGGEGNQTADLTDPGSGKIYSISSGQWEDYEGGDDPSPTTAPIPTQSGSYKAYCRNAAGWSDVYAYCWNSDSDKNAQWPGVKMTNIGDSVFYTSLSKNYANIIFNNGSGTQTDDMSYKGSNMIYNNSTGEWENYGGDDPTPTTSPTTSPTASPTTSPTQSSDKMLVFCKNTAGWPSVNAYCWNSDSDSNAGWPGIAMTNIGDNVWQYVLPKSFKNIIFNSGSDQTTDLVLPGSGMIYDNSTGAWDVYDTSSLRVLSFKTDIASPQYTGCDINISAEASGEGTVNYKFSVKNGSNTTVLSNYSEENSVTWTPNATGTYTIILELKDTKGNTNKREMSYTIKDDSSVEEPIIKSVTPGSGYILKGSKCDISVKAGGGNTGTKLLFYKYTIEDSKGNTVNVPYYTRSTKYSFTPSAVGKYTLTVSVQASDVNNTTAEKEYELESVSTMPSDELKVKSFTTSGLVGKDETITLSASASGGTSPYKYQFLVNNTAIGSYSSSSTCSYTFKEIGVYNFVVNVKDSANKTATKSMTLTVSGGVTPTEPVDPYMKGDANGDGKISVNDVTIIQQYLNGIAHGLNNIVIANSDVNGDIKVSITDATEIQRYLAGLVIW